MLLGIVSDIHSNLPALTAILEHMNERKVDIKVSLGDHVGYCAQPNECIDLVVENFQFIIKGNHDEACVDLEYALGFNDLAKSAIEWNSKATTSGNKEILAGLQYGIVTPEGLMFVHGSPANPFSYIFDVRDASVAFGSPLKDFKIAFVGHTHQPMLFANDSTYINPVFDGDRFVTILDENKKYIINVGSGGQPRDLDTRSCYATYDTDSRTLTWFRVPYSVDRTIAKMQQADFDDRLWQRLMHGM